MQQVSADLRWSELIGLSTEMAGDPDDLLDVGALRVRRQIADLHILDQAAAKRAHRQLLCGMNGATWRRRTVSLSSCQTQEIG